MLLDRQRIVGAALHRRVVADDHHLPARHAADAGDHARAGHFAVVHVAGGELADLEERRAGIEQPLDAVARKQLAARDVALAALLGAAQRRLGDVGAQFLGQRAIMRGAGAELVAVGRDLAVDARRAHAPLVVRWSKSLAGSPSRCLTALQSALRGKRVRNRIDSGRSCR